MTAVLIVVVMWVLNKLGPNDWNEELPPTYLDHDGIPRKR